MKSGNPDYYRLIEHVMKAIMSIATVSLSFITELRLQGRSGGVAVIRRLSKFT
jgi:hypothetical protein